MSNTAKNIMRNRRKKITVLDYFYVSSSTSFPIFIQISIVIVVYSTNKWHANWAEDREFQYI